MRSHDVWRLAGVACFAAILAACGGKVEPRATEAPVASVVASTAIPTQSGPPIIRTSLSGDCRITPLAAEIRVQLSVTAAGSTRLTRVRLLQDGAVVDDSGDIEQGSYQRVLTFDAQPGEQHTYRVAAESQSGPAPAAQTTVRCGAVPSPSPGPRA